MPAYNRTIIASDFHFPEADPTAVSALLDFATAFEPRRVIINGDLIDAYAISTSDRAPSRLASLQEEIDLARRFLNILRDDHPDAEMVFIAGDHEARLRRLLWRKANGLDSLRCLDLDKLLGLEDLGFAHIRRSGGVFMLDENFVIEHGDSCRSKTGAAQAMLTKRGVCGVSGHTHRLGKAYRTTLAGTQWWVEGGCLCEVDARRDCQQGFTVAWQDVPGGEWDAMPVRIVDGRVRWPL